MIKIKGSQLHQKQGFISIDEIEIIPCSEQCVFNHLPTDIQVVKHGSKEFGIALLSNGELYIPINNDTRGQDHPLYYPFEERTKFYRAGLLALLMNTKPENVIPVKHACSCGFVIRVLPGPILKDIGNRPAWHKVLFGNLPANTEVNLTWPKFIVAMLDLARGMQSLHQCGCVHADPYPFNAVLDENHHAVWIDLNDIAPLGPEELSIDWISFLIYTFLLTLADLPDWQPEVVQALFTRIASSTLEDMDETIVLCLEQATIAVGDANGSYVALSLQAITDLLIKSGVLDREDCFGAIFRKFFVKGLFCYFKDYVWNAVTALKRQDWLETEQARHRLAEADLQRIYEEAKIADEEKWKKIVQEHEKNYQELKSWCTSLENGKTWLEQQVQNWQIEAEKLNQINQQHLTRIEEQDRTRIWLEQQATDWQEQAEQLEQINQQNRAWIEEQVQAKTWLEQQVKNWQEQAEQLEQINQQNQAWIEEQAQAKTWLEQQVKNWQEQAEQLERTNSQSQQRMAELSSEKEQLNQFLAQRKTHLLSIYKNPIVRLLSRFHWIPEINEQELSHLQ